MRSLSILCLLLFTSLLCAAQSAQTSSASSDPPKRSATIAGNVLRLDTGEPLKKARATLQSRTDGSFSVFYLTDEQGHFLFESVPPGSYNLQVSRDGYVDAEYGQKKPGAPGAILTLTPGQRMTDLVFKLSHGAAISGHVLDEDGEPIAKAVVLAYRASKRQDKTEENGSEPTLTNDLGEFRIFDLAPGRYYIAVNYRRESPFHNSVPAPNQKLNMGYLPSYYPSTSDPARAQAITVSPGDEVRSVDFILRASVLVTVRGKVINAVGVTSAASGFVSLSPRGRGLAQAVQGFDDDFQLKEGGFVIRNVPPGSYDLTAGYKNKESDDFHLARRQLEVGNSDVDGLTITISPGAEISGHLAFEGAPASDPGNFHVSLRPLEGNQVYFSGSKVKPDGSFQLKNVSEGSYRPVVHLYGPGESFFLKSARYGSATVGDSGFTVQPGADVSLELVVSSRAAQLSGVVLDADSLPAVSATVVLIPDAPHRGAAERYESTITDQNGKFTLTSLAPGDYRLFSWDSAEESEEDYPPDWMDPEWLKPYEAKGEPIHLEEADQKSVNLKLIETHSDSPGSD